MLRRLYLQEFVIVDASALELAPGLNVLTGETGAGKSILIDALELLSGGRGSADWLRGDARRLRLEASFDLPARSDRVDEGLRRLEEKGVPFDEDRVLLVRREISADGRSRSFLNGSQVLVGDLRAAVGMLLHVVGQGEAKSLLSARTVESLLDRFGASSRESERYRRLHAQLRETARRLEETSTSCAAFEREEDWLRFQVDEIERAELEAGERDRLHRAFDQVRDREEFERRIGELRSRIGGDEGSILDHLESLLHELRSAEGEPWTGIVDGLRELREQARELDRRVPDLEDPEEIDLVAIEERLRLLDKLVRKYGEDEDAILSHAEGLRAQLDEGRRLGDALGAVQGELEALRSQLGDAGAVLSRRRKKSARDLETKVRGELRELGMPHAELAFEFNRRERDSGVPVDGVSCEPFEGGIDQIAIRFRSHPELAWGDLGRSASGGELSRVLLALQSVLGEKAPPASWIFDEIDAGIGGETANRVGERLARLSRRSQVLLVTHAPAIAARADRHFRVVKEETAGRVRARIEPLEGPDRLDELARMLSGQAASPIARKHAAELLASVNRGAVA